MKVYTKAKCRNGGEIFIMKEFSEADVSKDDVLRFIAGPVNNRATGNITAHECSNGEIGIADGIALVLEE